MVTSLQHRGISQVRLRVASAVLALTIALGLGVIATPVAQTQTFSTLYSFKGNGDAANPSSALTLDAMGNLYGTTLAGGAGTSCFDGCGAVFRFSRSGKETVLYSFTGGADGGLPQAALIQDAKGALYGTTVQGGTSNFGTIFKLNRSGKESVLYSFVGYPNDGQYPYAGLVQDANGSLYGATYEGGTYSEGTIFELKKAGTEGVLYSFGADSAFPHAGVILDMKGNLYGTTFNGGANGWGAVFKVSKTGKETVLYSFSGYPGDGAFPAAGLVRDAKGNLYGTTQYGGPYNAGTVFKVDRTGKETLLYSFNGNAWAPLAGLIRDAKGILYGTTTRGGSTDNGTVFMINRAGRETVLHSFSYSDGATPDAGLIQDAEGNLYGTTYGGGDFNRGVLFKLIPR